MEVQETENVPEFKGKFDNLVNEFISKTPNHCILTREKASCIVRILKDDPCCVADPQLKSYVKQKQFQLRDFPQLKLRKVLCIPSSRKNPSKAKLGRFEKYQRVALKDEFFSIIYEIHTQEGSHKHLGYKSTVQEINRHHAHIPLALVLNFIKMCPYCSQCLDDPDLLAPGDLSQSSNESNNDNHNRFPPQAPFGDTKPDIRMLYEAAAQGYGIYPEQSPSNHSTSSQPAFVTSPQRYSPAPPPMATSPLATPPPLATPVTPSGPPATPPLDTPRSATPSTPTPSTPATPGGNSLHQETLDGGGPEEEEENIAADHFMAVGKVSIIDIQDLLNLTSPPRHYTFLVHYIDVWSNYSVLWPMKLRDIDELAFGIANNVFAYFGCPKEIIYDTSFDEAQQLEESLRKWSKQVKVNVGLQEPLATSAPVHWKIMDKLQELLVESWEVKLSKLQYISNTKLVTTTDDQISPFKAVTGSDPKIGAFCQLADKYVYPDSIHPDFLHYSTASFHSNRYHSSMKNQYRSSYDARYDEDSDMNFIDDDDDDSDSDSSGSDSSSTGSDSDPPQPGPSDDPMTFAIEASFNATAKAARKKVAKAAAKARARKGKGTGKRRVNYKRMMDQKGEKPFQCEACQKRFRYQRALKKHMKLHKGLKLFQCEICQKTFAQSSHLKCHMMFHTGEKPFQCEICPKRFTQNCDLKKHLLRHKGEKPFQCSVCGKRFTENGSLKKHLMIHRGDRPHMCELCGKTFKQTGHLRKHMQIHQGEDEVFECVICLKKYAHRGHLNNHMLYHGSTLTDFSKILPPMSPEAHASSAIGHSSSAMVAHSSAAMVAHSSAAMVAHSSAAMVAHSSSAIVGHSSSAMVGHSAPAIVGHNITIGTN